MVRHDPSSLAEDLHHILSHTHELWDELRGKRLFITGGTGFFGTWMLETLHHVNQEKSLGLEAVVLTRDSEAFKKRIPHLASQSWLQFHEGDIRSFSFPKGPFSHVIHAATPASAKLNEENPTLMLDTIVEGTKRTLEFTKSCGAKKYLLTSSGAIYGRQPTDLTHVTEDYSGAPDPMDTRSAYGQGKRIAEHLCATYHQLHGIEPVIARCFAFVGPHLPLDIHFAIGNFVRDGLAGKPVQINGDGTPYRSYLYAADLMIWLWTILVNGRPCHPYNVGSEEDLPIAEVGKQVADHFGVQVKIAKDPTPGRPRERYVPSTQRACEELGLKTRIGLSEAIERTARWNQAKRSS